MEQGSRVAVAFGDEMLEGIFISEKPHFTIKLESGYNLVLDRRIIKDVRTLAPPKKGEAKKDSVQQGKDGAQHSKGKKISILHLGGTVASKIDYTTGAVIAQFSPEDIIRLYPEITEIAQISSRLIRNMQSEMMRFAHYNIIADAIAEEVERGAEGIIITHGTDELHYTSAAVAFMFETIPVPVVFVASQRSSDRPSSDARQNLVSGVVFASHARPGTYICMHEGTDDDACAILPGIRSRKLHTTRRDAFKPVNSGMVARVHPEKRTIELLSPEAAHNKRPQTTNDERQTTNDKPPFKRFNERLKVGVLKARPQMHADEFLFYKDWDGLVLEGLGLGHMPTEKIDEFTGENEKILAAITKLAEKMPVVFASQCIFGRVNFNVYTPGRELLEAGVLGNQLDIPPETAYIKLAWLLSNYKKDDVKRLYQENLRGEITERSESKEAFSFHDLKIFK